VKEYMISGDVFGTSDKMCASLVINAD